MQRSTFERLEIATNNYLDTETSQSHCKITLLKTPPAQQKGSAHKQWTGHWKSGIVDWIVFIILSCYM